MKPLLPIFTVLCLLVSITACGTPAPTPTRAAANITPTLRANTTAPQEKTPDTSPTQTAPPAVQPTAAPPTATTEPVPTTQPPNNPTTEQPISPTSVPSPVEGTAPAPADTTGVNNRFSLDIEQLATDLRRPVFITNANDGSGRLFIVEQIGTILIYQNGTMLETPFLRVGDKLTTTGNEQGLLGFAFDPDYKNNGFVYVNYSAKDNGDNVIERYQVSNDPNVIDKNSGHVILTIPGLEPNHNGGMLAFGPDGYLYIGTGDGGGGGDRHGTIGNGQALDTLLGKILRIDVRTDPYTIPADTTGVNNPFINTPDAKPEIWAYGLRNPWRFSFDRVTGDLYIGDVGQSSQEEIDFQPAGSQGGANYGWRILEANECYDKDQNCDNPTLVAPISYYSHDLGCSVTGGYVYRGSAYPWLVGQYIYADYCTGVVWATARDASGTWQTRQVTTFDDTISSFGQGEDGELYIAGHKNGSLYKLTSSQ